MTNVLIQYGSVVLGVLGALIYAYIKGKSDSKKSLEAEQNKKKLDDIKEARKIDDEVRKVPDSDLDSKLSKWMRND